MTKVLKEVMERAKDWSAADQQNLAEYAREIDARRNGVYVLTDDERAAVKKGRDQARRGKFVPQKKMQAFWKKHGVI